MKAECDPKLRCPHCGGVIAFSLDYDAIVYVPKEAR